MDVLDVVAKLLSLGITGLDLYDAIQSHQAILNPIFTAMKNENRTFLKPEEWQALIDRDLAAKTAEKTGLPNA